MKKKTQKAATYTISQLNKIASGNKGLVLIEYDNRIFTLDYFQMLEEGDDYYDPEDEAYQDESGKPFPLVAYVEEMGEHLPWFSISRIFVASEVGVK